MPILLRRSLLLLFACLVQQQLFAQTTFPYNGVYESSNGYYAITGATIITAAGETPIEGASLVIQDGRIVAINRNGAVPEGAQTIDLGGQFLYPSFVDIYSEYGIPEAESVGSRSQRPQPLSNREGAYGWNEALKPDFAAHEHFTPNDRAAKQLRQLGFGTVVSHQQDGISRGTSVAVTLREGPEQELILSESPAHHLSFRKGVSTQNYPNSLTGTIALLRQTYLDGDWYANQNGETNLSLAAWNEVVELPQVFQVNSWQDALRATRIAQEFNQQYILHTNGDSYQRLDAIAATGSSLIVPLMFPKAYDVADPFKAHLVSLAQLRHWERAPTNPGQVAEAGIPMALTLNRLAKPADFTKAIQKAIEHGLSTDDAFQALTLTPARLMGIDDQVGSLAPGKWANFIVADKTPLAKGATIFQNWIQGHPHVLDVNDKNLEAGSYQLAVAGETFTINATEKDGKTKLSVPDLDDLKVEHSIEGNYLQLRFQPPTSAGFYRLSGYLTGDKINSGRGQSPTGEWVDWQLEGPSPIDTPDVEEEEESDGDNEEEESEAASDDDPTYASRITFPNIAYGWDNEIRSADRVVIRNATVWTNEADGILENTDVLLEGGQISRIGANLPTRGARIIDGEGMHLTSGIIDEHSHIAISRGVNEGTQASTAEVRMGDVVDAVDIDVYRQLSGGVTTSQLLHGSANPIGGQSAIIKLRWGHTPEEMLFEGADGFIKFALGENVKQSNWGDNNTSRFPQTRMGVEETFENYFNRAQEYGQQQADGEQPRRDLELDALLEILRSERFISCHSYQQGEITMLMRVAESFGFRVNTFTHILEGYKVADKMAEHGAGGSTFSDWWAYKYEVVEAIPHNADIMAEQGVVVAINSDDAEMGRRLNQEAGKSVLYGDMPEEDALKMVTLNPARLLHIDDQVGSIKVGKDADVVLWSDHPLSIYARPEYTFIDGIDYYNRERDEQMRQAIVEERNALIQKSLDAKAAGEATQPAQSEERQRYHCNSIEGEEDHGHEH